MSDLNQSQIITQDLPLQQIDKIQSKLDSSYKLLQYFDLYPEIQVIIDKVDKADLKKKYGDDTINVSANPEITYAYAYDVSKCASDITISTTIKESVGTMQFTLNHEACAMFSEGDRVRLYFHGKTPEIKYCAFCGKIFTRAFDSNDKIRITAFDNLRYFKVPLLVGKESLSNGSTGFTIGQIFDKLCNDLALPHEVSLDSKIPVQPLNFQEKTAFNIMEHAIDYTMVNSMVDDTTMPLKYTFFHEYNTDDVQKTGGKIILKPANLMTVDVIATDSDLITDFKYETSIDRNTYNEILFYKEDKTYISAKTGKTLKNGKNTGTISKAIASANYEKALYGYLPLIKKVNDKMPISQMEYMASKYLQALRRPTQTIQLECYGIIGLRAGHLLPIYIENLGDTQIGRKETVSNEDSTDAQDVIIPQYRTIYSCTLRVEKPLKMSLTISAKEGDEFG